MSRLIHAVFFLEADHGHWRVRNKASSRDLPAREPVMSAIRNFETVFLDRSLPDTLIFLHLVGLGHARVDSKDGVFDNYFVKPVLLFLLFVLGFLGHHIVTRDKHRFKGVRVRKSRMLRIHLTIKVDFSFVLRPVTAPFQLLSLLGPLAGIGVLQVVEYALMGLLGMCVEVGLFVQVIETIARLPSCLII